MCQKQVSKSGTSNYLLPTDSVGFITCPCPRYHLLAHDSLYQHTLCFERWHTVTIGETVICMTLTRDTILITDITAILYFIYSFMLKIQISLYFYVCLVLSINGVNWQKGQHYLDKIKQLRYVEMTCSPHFRQATVCSTTWRFASRK